MLIGTVLTSLLPAFSDGLRNIVAKLTGSAGAKPQNVREAIELMAAETQKAQALAALDKADNVSLWVANIRALQRPAAVLLITIAWIYALASGNAPLAELTTDLESAVVFYLFGERSLLHLRRKA
ncbi:MAG: hypothetical protein AB1405_02025 [Bdellovibrionota bacterium]